MYTADRRRLTYPLQYPLTIVSDTETDPEIVNETIEGFFPSDPDERTDIVLNLSLNEYVILANCIDVGRDIAYGDDSIQAWNLWCRVLSMVDYCAIVADCIETSNDVSIALNNRLSVDQSIGQGSPEEFLQSTKDIVLADGSICDPDNLFAFATQVIDFTNQNIVDFYERVEASTFFWEQVQTVLEWIPILDQVGADNLVGLIENFVSQLGEAYDANYDLTIRDQLRCDLFCMMLDNDCELDWNALAQYFADKAVYEIANLDLQDIVQFFSEGLFSGTEWVYVSMWFHWGLLSLLGRFGGNATKTVTRVLQSMINDTDPDWSTICDECADVFSYQILFGTAQGHTSEYTVVIGNSSFTTLVGSTLSTGTQKCAITIPLPSARQLTNVNITQGRDSSATGGTRVIDLMYGGIVIQSLTIGNTLGVNSYNFNSITPSLIDEVRILSDTGTASGSVWYTQITLDGDGSDPWA